MARMREIGASLDKGYRDDLNYNFGLLEALIGEANGLTDNLREEMLGKINNLQQQIDMLTGENIGELLERLNDSIQQALTAAQEARTAKTATEEATALATTATELANASALLAEEKANYANEKAVLAQEAADNANQEASNLSQLKIDVVQATQDANTATGKANQATQAAQTATDAINVVLPNVTGLVNLKEWSIETQYKKNNFVTLEGNGYMALRDNKGVRPPSFPVLSNADWAMFVQKGEKGEQGTGVRILGTLPDESALPPLGEPGDAYLINGDLYVWSDTTNDWTNVGTIKGPKGDTGPQGPEGPQGLPGKDADLTEVNQEIANLQQTVTDNKTEVTEHLGQFEQLKGTVDDLGGSLEQLNGTVSEHGSRLTALEEGGATNATIISGLNREVAYMKLKQDTSDRIKGGTLFAEDFKGNGFGITLDRNSSSNIQIKDGKLLLKSVTQSDVTVTAESVASKSGTYINNENRPLLILDDGTLIAIIYISSSNTTNINKKTGAVWNNIASMSARNIVSPATDGKSIFTVSHSNGTVIANYYKPDGSTLATQANVETGVTNVTSASCFYDRYDNTLYAVYSARKTGTSTVSNNIRVSKCQFVNGLPTTWTTPEAITSANTSGIDYTDVKIVSYRGRPVILFTYNGGGNNNVQSFSYKDGAWIGRSLEVGVENKSWSSITVDSNGRLIAVWRTNTTPNATIYYNTSADLAESWGSSNVLATGSVYFSSVGVDSRDNVFITYTKVSSLVFRSSPNGGQSWTNEVEIAPNVEWAGTISSFTNEVVTPPVLYSPLSGSNLLFTGKWKQDNYTDATSGIAVFDIPSSAFVGSYVQIIGNLTITATANDSPMDTDLQDNEYEFLASLPQKATIKLKLSISRPDISGAENDAVTRILGGIA